MRRPVRSYVRWRALAASRNGPPVRSYARWRAQTALGSSAMVSGLFKVAAVVVLLGGAIHYLSDKASEKRNRKRLSRGRRSRSAF